MATENPAKVFQALTSLFVQPAQRPESGDDQPGSVVVMTEAWYDPGELQFRIDQYVEGHRAEAAGTGEFPREIHHEPMSVTPPRCVFDIEGIAKERHKELLAELRAEIKKHSLILDERCLLENRGDASGSAGTARF